MKNIKLGFGVVLVALTALTSCKKLDLKPYSAIELSQGFQSVKDAASWNVGLYSSFRGRQYSSYMITQDVQGDQLNASLDYGNRNGAPHRWGDSFLADETSGQWTGYYSAIANVNIIINGYATITPTSAAETASFNKYKGDAYLARAYYYHQLALRYTKAYNPTTAATDLGLPLVLTYDVTALPARATLKATYDQILSDIAVAKPLLAATPGVQGATTFNTDVATALEARVRFYMQDWTNAYTLANSLIASNKYPLYTTAASLKSYWTNDGKQEDIMQLFTSAAEQVNTNSIYLGLNGPSNFFAPDFIPTQAIVDTYETADNRKSAYFEQKLVQIQGLQYPNTWLVNKYPGNPTLFTGTYTNYQNAPKVFRIAEMYLIAAESANNAGNTVNAITAISALRVARGVSAATGLSGTTLTQFIRDERTRELAFEGYRIWDLKRWGLGFTRGTPQNTGMLNTGTNFTLLSIDASNPKFTWGLPTSDVTINSNLVQNPGW